MPYPKLFLFLIMYLASGVAGAASDEYDPPQGQGDSSGYDSVGVDACTDAGISSGLEGEELETYIKDCLDQYYPRQQDIPYDQG